MKRSIDNELKHWKTSPDRKVLLLRGARQVGKTYAVRQLGADFTHLLEVNFEEEPAVKRFFEGSLNPLGLCQKLGAYFNVPVISGQTLLFLDEIQACPHALKALRFFYEKMPQLHVIAAGSLLEFVLEEMASFGVGRITSLFMYPMTLVEFVEAIQGPGLAEVLQGFSLNEKLEEPFHQQLTEALRSYLLVGGMPAVVEVYRRQRDLRQCQLSLDALVTSIQDDFGKYKARANVAALREVFTAMMYQAGAKFKYSNVSQDLSAYHYKTALNLLHKAGLAYKVHHSSARGIPLGAQADRRKFKVLPWDIGVIQRQLGFELSEWLTAQDADLIHKGKVAELFAGLELVAAANPYTPPQLHYWHREARSSNAEVDYVIQQGRQIIPIEVKSGARGQMQSLKLFLSERNLKRGVCLSLQPSRCQGEILFVPLYAAGSLRNILF